MAVVVWDADGTLWDGLILQGQEGEPPILRPLVADVLKEVGKRGHTQVVISRNDRENIDAWLRRLGIDKFFQQVYADWGPKSDHFHTLMGSLMEGTDVIFYDDQEFNIHEVQRAYPSVIGFSHPDAVGLLDLEPLLRDASPEDRERVRLIREQDVRRQAQDSYSGEFQEFLKTTALRLTIYPTRLLPDKERALDLLNRTNELKATRDRYQTLPRDVDIVTASLIDKYGDYGIIAAMIVEVGVAERGLIIRDMAVSCRTMGRGVGSALVTYLVNEAVHYEYDSVGGRIQHTDLNGPMRDLYSFLGFKKLAEIETGQEKNDEWWSFNLTWAPGRDRIILPKYPEWLEVTIKREEVR
jgi:FkbH-like protein